MGRKVRIETPRVFQPLLGSARYKGAHGGRGSGKSHFFAESLVERALMSKGLRWACIRENQRSLEQSVKRLIEDKIEKLGVGHLFRVLTTHIETPGDGIIIFQGMQNHTADSIKSLEGFDGAWVEEAQRFSQRSLDLLRPTLRKSDSELWFSWNPEHDDDPVDVLLRGDHPPPNSIVVEANYLDNPWFPEVLKAELEYDRSRDADKFTHIWLGQYLQRSNARVFNNWKIEEFDTTAGATFRLGADWGFAVDPSVLVRCYLDGRRLYIDHEAYMVGCEIDQLPDLFDRVPNARDWFITADSARPETISYMRSHGFPKINSAFKGPKSIEEGIEFLKSFDIIVHPRCQHVIDELTLYSYKTDKISGQVLPELSDKHNHTIDSLRYACEGLRKAAKAQHTVKAPRLSSSMGAGLSAGWMG